jgi:alkylhydroperoxidase/carboxymuconolactone decarboxylase family protein YurZ
MNEASREYREAVVARVLTGPGSASAAARQAAFDNRAVDNRANALMDKVARRAWTVTDDDVAATKRAGVSEDEIFEFVVAAALGQATRQLNAALAALDEAIQPAMAEPLSTMRDGGSR